MQSGKYFDQGYINGIESQYGDIKKAATKASSIAVGALRDGDYANSLSLNYSKARSVGATSSYVNNNGDNMTVQNLTIQVSDIKDADSLYKALRKISLKNR